MPFNHGNPHRPSFGKIAGIAYIAGIWFFRSRRPAADFLRFFALASYT